jgi:hypothetical protein
MCEGAELLLGCVLSRSLLKFGVEGLIVGKKLLVEKFV